MYKAAGQKESARKANHLKWVGSVSQASRIIISKLLSTLGKKVCQLT